MLRNTQSSKVGTAQHSRYKILSLEAKNLDRIIAELRPIPNYEC